MQNKKTKNQLQKELRRMHERVGAGIIALGMLTGTVAVSAEIRHAASELVVHPVFAVIEHSIRESEVAHRAMRLDSVMPLDPISGE